MNFQFNFVPEVTQEIKDTVQKQVIALVKPTLEQHPEIIETCVTEAIKNAIKAQVIEIMQDPEIRKLVKAKFMEYTEAIIQGKVNKNKDEEIEIFLEDSDGHPLFS